MVITHKYLLQLVTVVHYNIPPTEEKSRLLYLWMFSHLGLYECTFRSVNALDALTWQSFGCFSTTWSEKINVREDKNKYFGISRLLLRYIQFPVCYSRTRHKAQIEAGHRMNNGHCRMCKDFSFGNQSLAIRNKERCQYGIADNGSWGCQSRQDWVET